MDSQRVSAVRLFCCVFLAAAIAASFPNSVSATATMESYISEVDGSEQPFGLYLPEPFDPNVPHPVVVHLHGGGGSANTSFTITDESTEWIMVKPNERGQHPIHTGLQQNDVFSVLREVRSRYPNAVDDKRIYMVGCSSAGYGSARLSFNYPGVFAGAAPVDGWYDNYWFHAYAWGPRDKVSEVHPSRAPVLEGLSPIHVAENAKHLSLYLGINTGDTLVIPEANKLRDRLNALGYTYVYDEFPGGHCEGYESRFPAVYQLFSEHAVEPNPEEVMLKANQLKYGSAYWVKIKRLAKSMQFATIEGRVTGKDKDTVQVTASGVCQYTLFLTPELVAPEQVSVLSNGELVYTGPPGEITVSASTDESGDIVGWSTNDTLPRGLRKTAQVEGPIGHAYVSRFLLVVGTTSKPDTTKNRSEAEQFAADWNMRNQANISPVDDTSITDDDIAASNLILFGTADSNSVIAAINDILPVRIWKDRIVAGAREYLGDNYGLFMVFANPLNPERYVVISRRSIPGWSARDVNLLGILWPDYVVFDTNIVPREAESSPFGDEQMFYHPDAWVEAGYFDPHWRLDNDEDGMDDIFEKEIIDADPDDAIAAIGDVNPADDFDEDGQDNLTECNAGTDATDPQSFLTVQSAGPDPADGANFEVSWKVAAGRSYSILWSDTADGPWHEISQLDAGDIEHNGNVRTWTDRGTDSTMEGRKPGDCPARFYKLAAYR